MPSTRKTLDYVVCHGPYKHQDGTDTDGEYFLVEVHPKDLLGDQIVKFTISGSSLPKGRLPHETAWAAGYKIIDHFRSGILPDAVLTGTKLRGIEATANELEDSINLASTTTEIFHAFPCPDCSEVVRVSGRPLTLGQNPGIDDTKIIPFSCSQDHSFQCLGKQLAYVVTPLPSSLSHPG